ncbi:hypothetical protein E2C01_021823 [Portunus trituberculatus]|uniref:Uncharacterized protein n=1 Tax=Portunus trituberculatus TaxID=210409 RepID=A0A5B7E5Y7_PORTR|nr:hypothetical protein [Portunus trituberculatus]
MALIKGKHVHIHQNKCTSGARSRNSEQPKVSFKSTRTELGRENIHASKVCPKMRSNNSCGEETATPRHTKLLWLQPERAACSVQASPQT